MTLPIPTSVEDITSEWLSAALRSGGDDVVVASFESEPVGLGIGIMSLVFRITPTYSSGDGPASVILKLPPPYEAVRQVARGQSWQPNAMEVQANGLITAFTSNASFRVGPWTVDASGASIANGPLALGLRVKIAGRVQNGVLVAREVRVLGGSPMDDMLQMRGVIAEVDTAARIFAFNGRRDRVSYAGNVTYENGSAASLTPGRRVTAYGRPSADGTLLEAMHIRIEN